MHVTAILAAAVVLPLVVYWRVDATARALHERALREQAEQIAGFLHRGADGQWRFELPQRLRQLYSVDYDRYGYTILTPSGTVLFSNGRKSEPLPTATLQQAVPDYTESHQGKARIFVADVPLLIDGQRLWIQVSEDEAHRDVLIDDIVAGFLPNTAWVIAPILLILLLVDLLIFRNALQPLEAASARAQQIGPSRTDLRLSESGMPREVVPLVRAVNGALDRLERGFKAQRAFVADVAHELRTPLAIIRSEVEGLPDHEKCETLLADIDNVTRIVTMLLDTAESETIAVAPGELADLHAVCTEAAGFMAPVALGEGKAVSVEGEEGPVWVAGNARALFQAVRNLIENAIRYTPPGSSVEVLVRSDGTVTVSDAGPGIPTAERERVFQRFWRGDRRRAGSAGLGLSIVDRIVSAHGGRIRIDDAPQGGAAISIALQVVAPTQR
jgi:signal transduction histidine kinase